MMKTESEMKAERYYDDVIAPQLAALAKDVHAHGMHFFALVEWWLNGYGRTFYTTAEARSLPLRMANWAAKARGNVDTLWLAVQNYAREYGHSSIFLHEQGIPVDPINKSSPTTPEEEK